jgi:hypothetical protein
MDTKNFEGTLVLEKLAEINQVDTFLDAVDSDDFAAAKTLMQKAGVNSKTIRIVLQKMADSDGEH